MNTDDFLEKEIYLNKVDKIMLKIDNKISEEKTITIIKEFGSLIRQIKARMDISKFDDISFDHIAIMLVVIHCTDLIKEKNLNIQTISATYKDLFERNILQQIFVTFLEPRLKSQIMNIVISCDMVIQYEKMTSQKEGVNMYQDNLKTKKRKDNINVDFDSLLDQYNDLISLHKKFDDITYLGRAKTVLNKMKKLQEMKVEEEVVEISDNEWENEVTRIISEHEVKKIYKEVKEKTSEIDKLLDEYNDTITLYDAFGDSVYKSKATRLKNKMIKLINEDE